MRHLFKKWTSTHQLMSTKLTDEDYSRNKLNYFRQVPIAEVEEFFDRGNGHFDHELDVDNDHDDDDDEGASHNSFYLIMIIRRQAFSCLH